MAKYVFSPLTAQDLEAIGDYIAQDNPHRAITFIAELRRQCDKIAAYYIARWMPGAGFKNNKANDG